MQEKEGGKSLFWPLIKDPPPRSSQNAAEREGEKKTFVIFGLNIVTAFLSALSAALDRG